MEIIIFKSILRKTIKENSLNDAKKLGKLIFFSRNSAKVKQFNFFLNETIWIDRKFEMTCKFSSLTSICILKRVVGCEKTFLIHSHIFQPHEVIYYVILIKIYKKNGKVEKNGKIA